MPAPSKISRTLLSDHLAQPRGLHRELAVVVGNPPYPSAHDVGDRGEHLAAFLMSCYLKGYRLAPSKADGVTGPDQVWFPLSPVEPLIVCEVKTRKGGSRAGDLTRYLTMTLSGRQGSQRYILSWADKVMRRGKGHSPAVSPKCPSTPVHTAGRILSSPSQKILRGIILIDPVDRRAILQYLDTDAGRTIGRRIDIIEASAASSSGFWKFMTTKRPEPLNEK